MISLERRLSQAATWQRLIIVAILFLGALGDVQSQLPCPRIDHVFPPGGQIGSEATLTLTGQHLDELTEVISSHEGLVGGFEEGKIKLSIGNDMPTGVHDLRVVGRFGVSNAMAFHVSPHPEVQAVDARFSRETALPLEIGQIVNAQATADQVDWYVFSAKAGQAIHLEMVAERLDSRMDGTLVVTHSDGTFRVEDRDSKGRDPVLRFTVPADGSYFIRAYDFTFGGGPTFPYRLALLDGSLPESDLADAVERPSDLAIVELDCEESVLCSGELADEPRHFDIDLDQGKEHVVEVFSNRLGETSDFRLSVDRLIGEEGEAQRIGEADDQGENPGGRRFPMDHRDPVLRFTAPEVGTYRVRIENQFSSGGRYDFVARQPTPTFHLAAGVESPTDENKALSPWELNLRKGGTAALWVLAERRDGFNEPIALEINGLPEGVSVSNTTIPAGQNQARLLFTADQEVTPWAGEMEVIGTAENGLQRRARGMKTLWAVNDYDLERTESRLTTATAMAIVDEPEPIILRPKDSVYEVPLGGRLEIPLEVQRSVEQVGTFTVTPVNFAGLATPPQLPLEATMNELNFVLDLKADGGNTFAAGEFTFYFRANGAQIRYRMTPEAEPADLRHVFLSTPVRVRILPQP